MCLAYKDEGRKEEILRVNMEHSEATTRNNENTLNFLRKEKKFFPVCFFKISKKNQILQSKFYLSVYETILHS
jgi:hypothetical protein